MKNPVKIKPLKSGILALFSFTIMLSAIEILQAQQPVDGKVFHDRNENGKLDFGEPGIADVLVSNGREIVTADENGDYEITTGDNTIIFVIKPREWTTAIDTYNIPGFYSIISSDGASGSVYPGLQPTGQMSQTIDFALYPQDEPDDYRVVVFGDTQARNLDEIGYIAHDSVQELIGTDAAFGTTLGDLVFDNLDVTDELNEVVGQIGIPWRHIIGNHDIDFSANSNWDVRGAYMRTYGPSWYAFSWGRAHFVAVDNIRWIVEDDKRHYRTGLGDDQLVFIENFLDRVPDDELVFFLMHIPWVNSTSWEDQTERDRLFRILNSHPNTVSLAAHTHRHYHEFIGPEFGWPSANPHHMVSMGAVCGSWWTGAPDEYGIPHSLMQDGTPTGYAFLDINGSDWKLTYKAARRPADFQMHIVAPDEVAQSEVGTTNVLANIFNALPDAEVEMKVAHGAFSSFWKPMDIVEQADPVYESMKEHEEMLDTVYWRRVGDANPNSRHLWQAALPENLPPGTYTIYVRSNDRWNQFEDKRIIRVTE